MDGIGAGIAKDRQYMVKSGYKYLVSTMQGISSEDRRKFWKFVWALQVPPKVKNSLWRAASNILPTYDNLIEKKVSVCSTCPMCHLANETILDIFVDCPVAKWCWCIAGVSLVKDGHYDFASCLAAFFDKCRGEEANVAAMIIWNLWYNRNEVVWHHKTSNPAKIVERSLAYLQQWNCARLTVRNGEGSGVTDLNLKWIKPPDGWLQCGRFNICK
ncbi:hypothetical protein DITRI_Ditri01bG0084400 [Diplodiscus trichospermus]